MYDFLRQLTPMNADRLLSQYSADVELLGDSIAGFRGVRLLSALKQLRASRTNADYRVILVNHGPVADTYVPKARPGEY